MPEPTHFLDQKFGPVAIIRPTSQLLVARLLLSRHLSRRSFHKSKTNKNDTGIVPVLMRLAEEAMRLAATLACTPGSSHPTHPNRALEASGPKPLWFGPFSLIFTIVPRGAYWPAQTIRCASLIQCCRIGV